LFCGGSLREGRAGSECPIGVCAHAARSERWNPFFAFAVTLVEAVCTIVLQQVNTGTAGFLLAKVKASGVCTADYRSMISDGPLDIVAILASRSEGPVEGLPRGYRLQNDGKVDAPTFVTPAVPF
jgi:hypothetical protein